MGKLLKVDFKRLLKSKITISILIINIIIVILGNALNNQFVDLNTNKNVYFLGIFLAFSQFSPMILGVVFVNTFTKDYSNGIDLFIKQLGYSPYKILFSKCIALLINTIPIIDILIIIMYLIYKVQDVYYLLYIVSIVNVCIIFVLVMSIVIALIVKNTVISIMVLFGMILINDVLNLFFYGIFSPADTNSFTSYIARKWVGASHSSSFVLDVPLYPSGVALSLLMPIAWIVIFFVLSIILSKGRFKK